MPDLLPSSCKLAAGALAIASVATRKRGLPGQRDVLDRSFHANASANCRHRPASRARGARHAGWHRKTFVDAIGFEGEAIAERSPLDPLRGCTDGVRRMVRRC